jgi:NAD(P)-dependent dehydrogenase (short-subunit alcohol dehydrogenase family)
MSEPGPPAAAIVTGGGGGIGREIALRLGREVAVLVVGRTGLDLDSVCDQIRRVGGLAATCAGDVANPATATAAAAQIRSLGWSLEHLVCNAGIGKTGPTESFDPILWRQIFDVNVHGCFNMMQACLPQLLASKSGVVTIVSSLAGLVGVAYDAAYTASKHALVGMARSWGLEFGGRGLTVVALCPSFIESEMTRRTIHGVMRRRGLSEEAAERRVAESCPAKRILPAAEFAEIIALIGAGKHPEAIDLAATGGCQIVHERPRAKGSVADVVS